MTLSGSLASLPLRDARELFERQYLMTQINRFGGNIVADGELRGMERSRAAPQAEVAGRRDDGARRGARGAGRRVAGRRLSGTRPPAPRSARSPRRARPSRTAGSPAAARPARRSAAAAPRRSPSPPCRRRPSGRAAPRSRPRRRFDARRPRSPARPRGRGCRDTSRPRSSPAARSRSGGPRGSPGRASAAQARKSCSAASAACRVSARPIRSPPPAQAAAGSGGAGRVSSREVSTARAQLAIGLATRARPARPPRPLTPDPGAAYRCPSAVATGRAADGSGDEGHHLRRGAGRLADRAPPRGRAQRRHRRRQQPRPRPPRDRHARRAGHHRLRQLPRRAGARGGGGRGHAHRRDPFGRGEHGHLPGGPFDLHRPAQDRPPARAVLPLGGARRSLPPRPPAHRRRDLARARGGRGRAAPPARARGLRRRGVHGAARRSFIGLQLDADCPVLDTPLRQLSELFRTLRAVVVGVRRAGRRGSSRPIRAISSRPGTRSTCCAHSDDLHADAGDLRQDRPPAGARRHHRRRQRRASRWRTRWRRRPSASAPR